MRNFSKLAIVVSHEGNDDSDFYEPVVKMSNGSNSVQCSDFESALGMLPPGNRLRIYHDNSGGVCAQREDAAAPAGRTSLHTLRLRPFHSRCILFPCLSSRTTATHRGARSIYQRGAWQLRRLQPIPLDHAASKELRRMTKCSISETSEI